MKTQKTCKLDAQHHQKRSHRHTKKLHLTPHHSPMPRLKSSTAIIASASKTAANLTPLPTILEKEVWTNIPLEQQPNYPQYPTSKADANPEIALPEGHNTIGNYELETQVPTTITESFSLEGVIVKGMLFGKRCWDLGRWLFDDEEDGWEGNGSWWV